MRGVKAQACWRMEGGLRHQDIARISSRYERESASKEQVKTATASLNKRLCGCAGPCFFALCFLVPTCSFYFFLDTLPPVLMLLAITMFSCVHSLLRKRGLQGEPFARWT
jgi:hypothetical protein